MTTKIVVRDTNGNVINIGPWFYDKREVEQSDGTLANEIFNPLPDGATFKEENVAQDDNGGWYVL